jgi:DNA (cytosine-5)-methyltransferase 1
MQVQPTDEPLRTVTAFPKGGSFAMVNAAIIPVTHQGGDRVHPMDEPLRTVTGANRGELAITSATMIQAGHGDGKPGGVQRWGQGCKDVRETIGTVTASGGHAIASASLIQMGYGESEGQQPRALDLMKPLGVVTAGGIKHAVATAYMAQMNGGFNTVPGHDLRTPTTTITNTGSQQQLVTANLIHLNNNCDARDVEAPVETIAAGGNHHALVAAYLSRQFGASIGQGLDSPAPVVTSGGGGKSAVVELTLSKDQEDGALRVAAFLMQYYSEGGQWGSLNDPINTITTKDRVALVTVTIQGTPYVIVDIGLRMLQPRELYRAQGFPESYVIEHGKDGRPFTKSEQVFMCGNSVSPPPMAAIAMCNNPWQEISETVAA